MSSDLITVGEAAVLLGLSPSMVRVLAREFKLNPVVRIGTNQERLFLRDHVLAFAARRAIKA